MQHGVRLLIDKKSVIYLIGTELDFSDGAERQGLHLLQPQRRQDLRLRDVVLHLAALCRVTA